MSFSTIDTSFGAAAILVMMGLLMHLGGFASPSWSGVPDRKFGLWMMCDSRSCRSFTISSESFPASVTEKFQAVRALETIGFILLVLTIAGSVWLVPYEKHRTRLAYASLGILSLSGGLAVELGVIIFATTFFKLSGILPSLYACAVGGSLVFPGSFYYFWAIRKVEIDPSTRHPRKRRDPPQRHDIYIL